MAITYEPIATYTVSGTSTSQVTFNSFSGYTDLRLIIHSGATTGGEVLQLIFNSDGTSVYSQTELYGNGTSALSNRRTGQTSLFVGGSRVGNSGSLQQLNTIDIMNYANSTTYKTIINRQNNAALGTMAVVGLWRSTNAITSLTVTSSTYNYLSGSTLTLYGITAA